jgi:hypothetical protein
MSNALLFADQHGRYAPAVEAEIRVLDPVGDSLDMTVFRSADAQRIASLNLTRAQAESLIVTLSAALKAPAMQRSSDPNEAGGEHRTP